MLIEMNEMKKQVTAILSHDSIEQLTATPLDFLESFCHLIGNQDSMLREDLMAPVFRTFGENDETFSNEEAAAILMRLTGLENMSYTKGPRGPMLIFQRSYSALVIASLLWRQHHKPFMSNLSLKLIQERLSPGFMTQHTA